MKFITIVFCMSALQIYSITGQSAPRGPISREQRARYFLNGLNGVSAQFTDDVITIIKQFKDDPFVMDYVIGILDIPAEVLDGRRNRISVNTVKNRAKDLPAEYRVIDDANILETILLRKLPAERINGVLTLFFALRNGATNEEIENALNYMYGSSAHVSRPNIPALATQSCSSNRETEFLATESEKARSLLKSVADIRSTVLQDLNAIFEKFPCNYWAAGPFARFGEELKQTFHADATKLDLCKIKRNWARRPTPPPNAGEEIGMVNWADVLKQVLSTRLNEEVYSGLIGVMQTLHSSVPNKQIENALTYLYGPQANIEGSC